MKFGQTSEPGGSWAPWLIAGGAVLLAVALLVVAGGRHTSAPFAVGPGVAAASPYAPSLAVTQVHMSEASNFAGGKVTYLDGQIANQGTATLKGITVQVVFRNELKEIAQKETLPLSFIRTHEPYVDTEPVGVSPLKPGGQREFRLIFDSVAADWNQQYPEVRVIQVSQ